MHYISTLDTLWNQTFRNFVHLDTCSQWADAVFSFSGQSRPRFFKTIGHKCVKHLNKYIFLYLDVWLVYSMTLHLSRPCAFCYESFVKSSWYRSTLVISIPKPGLFCQIRFQAPFRWYPKIHCTDRLFYTLDARNALYLHSGILWNQTFRNFAHLNTCSQRADAVFSFFGQSRPQFFKKFGHNCVKLLNIYIFLYLDVWLVYSMTLHLSRPCAFYYEPFVKSSWCMSALVISTTKLGLFSQTRFHAPFWWYPKILLNGSTFLYVRRKKCTISPLWNTLESNFSKFCTPKYLFSTCRCSF